MHNGEVQTLTNMNEKRSQPQSRHPLSSGEHHMFEMIGAQLVHRWARRLSPRYRQMQPVRMKGFRALKYEGRRSVSMMTSSMTTFQPASASSLGGVDAMYVAMYVACVNLSSFYQGIGIDTGQHRFVSVRLARKH